MKIEKIYIGGWFQRTMLQLSEIYDFLRESKSQLNLNQEQLDEYRKQLNIGKIDYGVSGEEYIIFTTSENITVKIFEDGLITLKNDQISEETLFADIERVKDYYEKKLSPAFSYLFSLGAPVPKELANIETVFPYFIVCDKAKREEISDLLSRTEKQKYFEFQNDKYDVIRGDKYYIINNKKESIENIERYVEEQIFIREFKGQLHKYLNLHRVIWEKIDTVKQNTRVKGSEIVKFTTKLERYYKTINLIEGRIKQMSTYISTREKIAKNDAELEEFLAISGYRYETLRDTLEYIKTLWEMTKNYVQNVQKQFEKIKHDVTSSAINSLTVVSSMTAVANILRLLNQTPTFSVSGIYYVIILAIVGVSSTKILGAISNTKKYDITSIEYDKNVEE